MHEIIIVYRTERKRKQQSLGSYLIFLTTFSDRIEYIAKHRILSNYKSPYLVGRVHPKCGRGSKRKMDSLDAYKVFVILCKDIMYHNWNVSKVGSHKHGPFDTIWRYRRKARILPTMVDFRGELELVCEEEGKGDFRSSGARVKKYEETLLLYNHEIGLRKMIKAPKSTLSPPHLPTICHAESVCREGSLEENRIGDAD